MEWVKPLSEERTAAINQRLHLLAEIESALGRMRLRGHHITTSYQHLQAKRDAVAHGASYQIITVTPVLLTSVGAMVATTNTSTKGQRLPARGSMLAMRQRLAQTVHRTATENRSAQACT